MATPGAAIAGATQEEPTIIVMEGSDLVAYQYGEEEVLPYAAQIGIDCEREYDLLWIAEAGLKAELPEPWKPCRCEDSDEIFFFNFKSGASVCQHPCDEHFCALVIEHRQKRITRATTLRGARLPGASGSIVLEALSLAGTVDASIVVAEPRDETFRSVHDKLVASMDLPENVVPKFILPDATLLGYSHFGLPVAEVLDGTSRPPLPVQDSA
jgi:centrosomal protein CEP164